MRGKRGNRTEFATGAGITPAGAGKTLTVARSCLASADHPRRCGENSEHVSRLRRDEWITPAGAGKTLPCGLGARRYEDHPRRCGENRDLRGGLFYLMGSPPQVRGKQGTDIPLIETLRITPAGAGKTACRRFPPVCYRDHPRRCGENRFERGQNPRRRGSPPQVRGKRIGYTNVTSHIGITPAGAGKTSGIKSNLPFPWDHPRRCGENSCHSFFEKSFLGSPPQVRGKR